MPYAALTLSPLLAALVTLTLFAIPVHAATPFSDWKYSTSLFILTTPEGANLPADKHVLHFPMLIRLNSETFDFSQTQPHGEDLRVSSTDGSTLPYQIDEWDPTHGSASVWVRIPKIQGQQQQEIRLHWGHSNAASASDGKSVFNASNGYLATWHMDPSLADSTVTLNAKDHGTQDTPGQIGRARRFLRGQGLSAGEGINHFPTGSQPHTTEAWFRSSTPNSTLVGWGRERAQGKVVMQFRSPPHINIDAYFSDANAQSRNAIASDAWTHVVHTYEKGLPRLYVNGVLDSGPPNRAAPLSIQNPASLWIGGWYGHYDFVGAIDEVRISNIARSPEWVRLQYENQKHLQTLVGIPVRPGHAVSLSHSQAHVLEGQPLHLSAVADGARKVYWSIVRAGSETLAAVDRLHFIFEPGRISGDASAIVRFKAVYENEVVSRDVPIRIQEAIPDPQFTLTAPKRWNGRSPIIVKPRFTNPEALRTANASNITVTWSITPLATRYQTSSNQLTLLHAQASGPLRVSATIHNGGTSITQSVAINVQQPRQDRWVDRSPDRNEKPVDNQFYPRDLSNKATLFYCGTLEHTVDRIFLRVYADDTLFQSVTAKSAPDGSYTLRGHLKPGLVRYRTEFGYRHDGIDSITHTATNLICGDVFLINGQSNAVATDWGQEEPTFQSDWIRTFGSMSSDPSAPQLWGNAVHRNSKNEQLQIGYWGMELGRRLLEAHRIPICILNGAVGGTRIDQHQRHPENPEDPSTIYGRLLTRARRAHLTHGVRAVLWHQGENDQGADGPTGGFGWETYRQLFIQLAGSWKFDYPNIQQYYTFQIWPKSCAMGIDGSDNRLREVQRSLPTAFSRLSVMSTLGIEPPGGCHFPAAGYAEFARLITPLIERDLYGKSFNQPITSPNLLQVRWATPSKDELLLTFDQPIDWQPTLVRQFYLDEPSASIVSGQTQGHRLRLRLQAPSKGQRLTYLDSKAWNQKQLLRGVNGLAALTFCEVPIADFSPTP